MNNTRDLVMNNLYKKVEDNVIGILITGDQQINDLKHVNDVVKADIKYSIIQSMENDPQKWSSMLLMLKWSSMVLIQTLDRDMYKSIENFVSELKGEEPKHKESELAYKVEVLTSGVIRLDAKEDNKVYFFIPRDSDINLLYHYYTSPPEIDDLERMEDFLLGYFTEDYEMDNIFQRIGEIGYKSDIKSF